MNTRTRHSFKRRVIPLNTSELGIKINEINNALKNPELKDPEIQKLKENKATLSKERTSLLLKKLTAPHRRHLKVPEPTKPHNDSHIFGPNNIFGGDPTHGIFVKDNRKAVFAQDKQIAHRKETLNAYRKMPDDGWMDDVIKNGWADLLDM